MAKSIYFQTNPAQNSERRLIESLSAESINLFGVELFFIPQSYANVDSLFREDRRPVWNKAFKVPVIFQDAVNGYSGDAIFSKYGLQNQQEFNFIVSAKEWRETAAANGITGPAAIRPMEGFIVYVPMQDESPMFGATDFFKLKFVDKFEGGGWFPLGIHHTFMCTTEKLDYASEHIVTGVPEIDSQEANFSNDVSVNANMDADDWKNNESIQTLANAFLELNEKMPGTSP